MRVHTDSSAAESARAIQATAYTAGQNVVFGAGQYVPDSHDGRKLLAHELTHVVQQGGGGSSSIIHRQQGGGAAPAADTNALAPANQPPLAPRPDADRVWYKGVLLVDDRAFMQGELRALIARAGLKGADEWMEDRPGVSTVPVFMPGHLSAGPALRPRTPLDAIREEQQKQAQQALVPRLLPIAQEVYRTRVRPEAVKLIEDFETQAKENVRQVLQANETQAKAEGVRYGITSERLLQYVSHRVYHGEPVDIEHYETRYDMQRDSPAVQGLQGAATVLLGRRREIENKQREQSSHVKWERDPYDPKGRILVPDDKWDAIGQEVTGLRKAYNELRTQLSAEYPALAAFSDLNQGTGDLQKIAEQGSGPTVAALIGEKIAEKLANIEKVRQGLDSGKVNVWRLPKIVKVTSIQMGAETESWKARLVADKQEAEEPGFWENIALLVLNIAAIVLAGPTGGLSLAVAAGVNIAVAAVHVQEYLLQEAMTGTAFDKARALSQDEPSLFWLAVEVIGAAVDLGAAASALSKTFKALAPLAKTAQAAKGGEEAVRTLEAVRTTATAERGVTFAERIVTRIKAIRGGESATLKAAGATTEEIKLLQAAGKAADEAAATGIGKAVKSVTGEVNVSRSGHIFSCASPCTVLRDKYAEVFARSDDVSKGFYKELQQLEGEAQQAAKVRAVAEASNNADELAKAEKLADNVKQKAAELERRVQQAHPELAGVPSEEGVISSVKQAEAESAVTTGRLSNKVDDLEKLKPVADKPPVGVAADDPLWKDYVSYFNERLDALKAGGNVKPPLTWEGYSEFLGKFRRGTEYQKKVLTGLHEEAKLAKEGKLPSGQKNPFEGMQDPVVESNVGVAGKQAGETTKFADQLIVDKATMAPGKTPKVTALSNKSRIWPEKLGAAERASVRSQVVADAEEALTKYGGDITLRRPEGPLKELFNQTVKAEPVYLVYDKALVKTAELEKLIMDAAAGVKSASGQKVIVIFR